jgi:hypothetical protein
MFSAAGSTTRSRAFEVQGVAFGMQRVAFEEQGGAVGVQRVAFDGDRGASEEEQVAAEEERVEASMVAKDGVGSHREARAAGRAPGAAPEDRGGKALDPPAHRQVQHGIRRSPVVRSEKRTSGGEIGWGRPLPLPARRTGCERTISA